MRTGGKHGRGLPQRKKKKHKGGTQEKEETRGGDRKTNGDFEKEVRRDKRNESDEERNFGQKDGGQEKKIGGI